MKREVNQKIFGIEWLKKVASDKMDKKLIIYTWYNNIT